MICKLANISANCIDLIFDYNSDTEAINKSSTIDLSFNLFTDAYSLPSRWDIIAKSNIFLSREYLAVLQHASPANMECHFVGLYKNNILSGIALAQYVNINNINLFPERKRSSFLKNALIKNFSSHAIIIGNNTITGQNAFIYSDDLTQHEAFTLLKKSVEEIKCQYKHKKIHINLIALKDFNAQDLKTFKSSKAAGFHQFSTQPNMIFSARENWHTIENYIADLNTKYRTLYNRTRKKAIGIEKRELSEADIKVCRNRINELYLTVVDNAAFNTFTLPENHFAVMKQQLGKDFIFSGYFFNEKLVGFSTIIQQEGVFNAYFLGYDAAIQKEKMLYLNMLYDLASYAIQQKCEKLNLGRSAMEIKSSVGAVTEPVYGFIKHTNPLLNPFMTKLFQYFEPKVEWKERSPFK